MKHFLDFLQILSIPLIIINWLSPIVLGYFIFQNWVIGILLIFLYFTFPYTYSIYQIPNIILTIFLTYLIEKLEGSKVLKFCLNFLLISITYIWQIIIGLFIVNWCFDITNSPKFNYSILFKICALFMSYYFAVLGVQYLTSKEKYNEISNIFSLLYQLGFLLLIILNYFYNFSYLVQFIIALIIIYLPIMLVINKERGFSIN